MKKSACDAGKIVGCCGPFIILSWLAWFAVFYLYTGNQNLSILKKHLGL